MGTARFGILAHHLASYPISGGVPGYSAPLMLVGPDQAASGASTLARGGIGQGDSVMGSSMGTAMAVALMGSFAIVIWWGLCRKRDG